MGGWNSSMIGVGLANSSEISRELSNESIAFLARAARRG